MSFFKNLFGGQKKEQKPAKPTGPKISTKEQERIQIEKNMNDLDSQIAILEDKEKKLENRIETLKAKAKECIAASKPKQAKKLVEDATKLNQQLQNFTVRKKVLADQRFALQNAIGNLEVVDAMSGAQKIMKQQEAVSDKIQDIIFTSKQAKMQQDQINDKFKDLAGLDEQNQEADEMMKQLMQQVKAEKQPANKNVGINIPHQQVQAQTNKKKAQQDEIARMMAQLG